MLEKGSAERKASCLRDAVICHCQPQFPLWRSEARPCTDKKVGAQAQGREKAASPGQEWRACLGAGGVHRGQGPKEARGGLAGVGEDKGRDPVRPVGPVLRLAQGGGWWRLWLGWLCSG